MSTAAGGAGGTGGAGGFPVNLPANFAPGYTASGYAPVTRGPTATQLSNQNNPPMPTLYVRNLTEKMKDAALRKLLREKFGAYGKVVDVRVARTRRMKGQAFVSFDKVEEAMAARDELDGKLAVSRPMVVQFAKSKADALAKRDGTYVKRKEKMEEDSDGNDAADSGAEGAEDAAAKQPVEETDPHNILFVQNLPESADRASVGELFQQFNGFMETRMVPGKAGIAFVEFASVDAATVALKALRGFKMENDVPLIISYAKK